ncbi:hypothetical protein HY988_05330 [Candidatus Micrarchaeota archaeon]|nr:hypothetical protein [Candidatus Micrarchaeota archaeon]
MQKSDIIKIVVLLIAVGFITELFFFGGGQLDFLKGNSAAQNFTGSVIFNGTIRTYEPYLILPSNTSVAVLDDLKKQPGFVDVRSQGNYLLIQTETRDDVFPLATYLLKKDIIPFALANVALPSSLELSNGAKKVNVSTNSGIVSIQAIPYLDSGSDVTVSMIVVAAADGQFLGYGSPNILIETIKVPLNATISSLDYLVYTYEIPWASRNSLPNLSAYVVQYTRRDSVIFASPLPVDKILLLKQLPYIVYIDDNSAQINETFTDMDKVQSDFSNTTLMFPSSDLIIRTNQTLSLNFSSSTTYSYTLQLPESANGYLLPVKNLSVIRSTKYPVGGTIELVLTGPAIGNKLLSVTPS